MHPAPSTDGSGSRDSFSSWEVTRRRPRRNREDNNRIVRGDREQIERIPREHRGEIERGPSGVVCRSQEDRDELPEKAEGVRVEIKRMITIFDDYTTQRAVLSS